MLRGNELYIADTDNNRILRSNIMGPELIKIAEISLQLGKRITIFRGARDFGGIYVWRKYLYIVESDNDVWNRLWQVNLENLKTRRLHKILETELINYPAQVLIKEKK